MCLQPGEASYPENVSVSSSHVIQRFILMLIRMVLRSSPCSRTKDDASLFAGGGDFRNINANLPAAHVRSVNFNVRLRSAYRQ